MLKHCTINDNSLSIVIPTFRHKLFHLVLEGFKAQTNKNFKLFIINDGGDDLTSIIKKFESSIDLEYYYLFTPENTCCLSAARNLGGSFAKTQRITFLDGDCIPSPNFVQQSSEYSFERIIVAGIRHRISEGDQNKLTNINDLETLQTKCDDRYLTEPQWRKDRLQHILKMEKGGVYPHYCHGFSINCRTEDFLSIGGFSNSYENCSGEDQDFAIRLCKLEGYTTLLDKSILCYHLDHGNSVAALRRNISELEISELSRVPIKNHELIRYKYERRI